MSASKDSSALSNVMDSYLRAYLESVGIVEGVSAHSVRCEVCGTQEHTLLVETVETGPDRFGRLPIVACSQCGYVFQNPRFNKAFYDTYYDKYYRLLLFGETQPERDFMIDMVRRGEFLYENLNQYLPGKGRLLDVGCSAGGLMVAFAKRGWEVLGTDPDGAYTPYGKEKLGLDIYPISAEEMVLPDAHFDLIIITGSLEHVFDVNKVLSICRRASKPEGQLFVEGRAFGYGIQKGYFSHNHRRYLSIKTIELLMLKHGWSPILSTEDSLCGPTRPGGVYVLGKTSDPMSDASLCQEIYQGRRDLLEEIKQKLVHLRGAA
jgi:ubiquinone/menaquinone biosynthesis C-methylase UbiE